MADFLLGTHEPFLHQLVNPESKEKKSHIYLWSCTIFLWRKSWFGIIRKINQKNKSENLIQDC